MRRVLIATFLLLACAAPPAAAQAPAFDWSASAPPGEDASSSRWVGMLHPNRAGHVETAKLIEASLRDALGTDAVASGDEIAVTVRDPEGERTQNEGEADVEELVWPIVAGLAGVLLTLFGALAYVTRVRRLQPAFRETAQPGMKAGIVGPPADRPDPASVADFGRMLEDLSAWIHRQVESVTILDEHRLRRRVSIDFTPPDPVDGELPIHAPIALLEKRTLIRFDLRDESGASVPLLSHQQNAAFSAGYLEQIAAATTGAAPTAEISRLCWQVAAGEAEEAETAVEQLKGIAALRGDDAFFRAARSLAHQFPVIVVLNEPRRRVIKLAYNQMPEGVARRSQRMGLSAISLIFGVPAVGDAASHHLEFPKAEGLDAYDATIVGKTRAGDYLVAEGDERGGEAHMVISGAPAGTRGAARVRLRASRSGILTAGPLLAWLATFALTAAWFALPELAGDSSGNAASILLAVPAAFGAFLGARKAHPLEATLLSGPRAFLFASGILTFVGAAALALDPSLDVLRVLLGGVAALSALPAIALTLTYFLPRAPSDGVG